MSELGYMAHRQKMLHTPVLDNTKLTEISLPTWKKSPNKIIINKLSKNVIMMQ